MFHSQGFIRYLPASFTVYWLLQFVMLKKDTTHTKQSHWRLQNKQRQNAVKGFFCLRCFLFIIGCLCLIRCCLNQGIRVYYCLRDQMVQNESWRRSPCWGSKGTTCRHAEPSVSWPLELTVGSKQTSNGPWWIQDWERVGPEPCVH